MSLNFVQIRTFYLVATLGTFAQAAQRMNTTQPAISARIAALERELGVRLFDRAGHRVALTPEGRSFLKNAEKLLEIQAQTLAMFGKGNLTGTLRIGAADTMAITWLPDFLAELRKLNSDLTIELHIGPSFRLREELLKRQLDIGFVNGPFSDSEMINHLLCDCPMVLAAAPSLGLHGRNVSISELENFSIYTFERMTRPYEDLTRLLRNEESQIRLSPISSLQTIVLMVRKGLGMGAVPLCVIEEDLAHGRLVLLDTHIALDDIRFTASFPQGPNTFVGETLATLAMQFLKARPPERSIKLLY
jgi:DNA-binding transcriptional LysR family regulator